MASLNEAAAHVFCSTKVFNEKVAHGVTKRAKPGEWDLDVVRRDFFAHYRSGASGRARAAGSLDLAAERAKLARAQTQSAEIRNGIAAGTYMKVASVAAIVVKEYSTVRNRILAIPGAIADALEGRTREDREEMIRAEITDALSELSDPEAIAEVALAHERGATAPARGRPG